ncbi:MAG: hypothetical protein QM778_28575 [Myxococcales bacterium]
MGEPAEQAYADTSAESAFSNYCNAQAEFEASPKGSARAAEFEAKRDSLWKAYLSAGGQRIAWHFPPQDPRQEEGRSGDGVKLPLLLFEHSMFVHVARFWIGESPRDSDQWESEDSRALKVWQQNNNLPITGILDRVTWSAMLELGYDIASAPTKTARDVAAGFQGSSASSSATVLTLERRSKWMLALDDSTDVSFANHWNLALMAALAYADGSHIDQQFKGLGEDPIYRGEVQLALSYPESYKKRFKDVDRRKSLPITYGEKQRVRPFVRPVSSPYQTKFLNADKTHTQAFVAWNDEHVIVAARGTETNPDQGMWQDLNSDAKANPRPWPYGRGGRVHTGFFEAFDSIRQQIDDALKSALAGKPNKPIYVCGHSLGGAIATLIACYLLSDGTKPRVQGHIRLYTYGQPRVGNVAFTSAFWQANPSFSYFRTANNLDLVTWVPAIWAVKEARQFGELGKLGLRMYSAWLRGAAADPNTGYVPPDWEARVIEDERKKSKAIDDYLKANLNEAEDYRHFGVHLPCGTDLERGAYLLYEDMNNPRKIEAWEVPRARGLYELKAFKSFWHLVNHMMTEGYLPHLAGYYERNLRSYLKGTPFIPLARPDLPRIEAQLFERMLKFERNAWAPPETVGNLVERMIDDWWQSEG